MNAPYSSATPPSNARDARAAQPARSGWTFRLGRFLGIDVYMHGTFLLLLAFFGLRAGMSEGAGAGVAEVAWMVALFGCVVLHEYGHALTARAFGIGTRDITLYPIGGVAISITSGVVSRTEVTNYAHGGIDLLGVQIDAAINSGNSGGPAFNAKGECVGVAFQSLKHDDAENIGYVIPPPVVKHFIHDYDKNKRYTGFPSLPFSWQRVESPAMRKWLKMKTGQKGVLISAVEPLMKDKIALRKNDVLVSIDGTEIASDGTVPFRAGEPITFNYLVSEKYVGESARVKYLRDGKMNETSITFNAMKRLVPWHIEGTPPSYFIAGGLVFTTVCVPFLKNEYGKDYDFDAPVKLLEKFCHGRVEEDGQQVVICAQVLAAEVNRGYEDLHNTIVKSFDGVKIANLAQLAQAVESSKVEFMRFELDHDISVVMDTKAANAATKAILKTHAIPSAKSADLR